MGRPRFEITSEVCAQAELMASRGLTKTQISASLGICRDTLHRKEGEYPDFSDAIKKGRADGLAQVANALFESALAGNVTAMIFYLKNRSPESWSDKPQSDAEEVAPESIKVIVVDASEEK